MLTFVLRRILQMIPVLLLITVIVFLLLRLAGDPVALLASEDSSPEQIAAIRADLGLDKPVWTQYGIYISGVVQGDWGTSLRYRGVPILTLVGERLPATLQLAAAALLVALLISLPLGVLAATQRGGWIDQLVSAFSVLGEAMPGFWLGIMLALTFAVQLNWLPASGHGTAAHLILPAVTLGTSLAALLTRLMRSSMIEALGQDYIRTATAKGLARSVVVLRHALRNSLLSYVTLIGLQIATLMAGAVVTEQVFAWPGIGLLTVQAVNARDMAVVQAVVLLSATIVMFSNLLVDIAYGLIDPRIQYR